MSLLTQASLVVTPNGYKEGKLYSVIPSDGSGDMSVVRATTATRVNSAGLVELVPYNLLSYSEQFDNAAWDKLNATITANAIAAPDGTLTADALVAANTTSAHILFVSTGLTASSLTTTIYAKKGTSNFIQLTGNGETTVFANFDLNAGITGTSSGCTSSITSAGNGWYRLRVSYTPNTLLGSAPVLYLTTSASAVRGESWAAAGTEFVYLWGAQANEGTIKDYQKTETRLNIPRLDYSNGTCPSLLVEPQRTNTILNSVLSGTTSLPTSWNFSTSTGTSAPTPSIYSQIGQAYSFTTAATRQAIFQNQSYTSGSTYSFSVFVESVTGSIRVDNVIFQTVAGTQTFYKDGVLINASDFIESGHRYTTLMVASSTTTAQVRIGNGTGGPTTATVVLSMPQLELGSYPTSYIPTTSASVTRNADVISKTGISSLIGQTEGTVFWEGQGNTQATGDDLWIFGASVNDTSTAVLLYYVHSSGYINCYINNGSSYVNLGVPMTITNNNKVAVGYKSGDFVMYVNGAQVDSNTSATAIPSGMNQVAINKWLGATGFQKQSTKAVALWKTRLTNAQLATLTTI